MTRLAIDQRGDAASHRVPLVMLHGWGMNVRVFDALRDRLHDLPTMAVDLPGHGLSPWWPDAARFDAQRDAVLAALPMRSVLVGWSLGAKLALSLAATCPQRIAGLVLLSATPRFKSGPDWPHGTDERAAATFHHMLRQDWQKTLADFVWLQVRGSREADATRRALESALATRGAPRQEALEAGLQLLDSVDLRPLIPHIGQPALLISGANDRVTTPAASRWLAENLPRATLHEMARAGHAPFLSHADEVAAAISAFVARLGGTNTSPARDASPLPDAACGPESRA